eukprot:CAMPEP_0185020322 /NCGR_PEP_ID=MMETSP1103-20130426/2920_1 /TAXON_ID=36769 /ORGANISM="Paraphysomonas bandaiensis, Strain Caron Lab Isolate" /LENGTH=403 /DNA_ID=CAMNT_0027551151 /DNA_START=12 /DNA_END=1223 /DNA_ORIENTATION=+
MSSVPEEKKTSSSSSSQSKSKSAIGISPTLKTKKINEAKEHEDRGNKFLKTSIFQWSPDYMAASAAFEAAAKCYYTAEELDLASEFYIRAADNNEACNTHSAAAMAIIKAADINKQQGNRAEASRLYQRAASLWGVNGEVLKAGEFLCKAAKELENVDPSKALELYYEGIGHVCPADTPIEMMQSVSASAPEMFRGIFQFMLKHRASARSIQQAQQPSFKIPSDELLSFANRMLRLYDGLDSEASLCRMMVTVTILQLETGDVVAADRTFLEHLGNSAYLRSTECKLAEDFISAFKQMDVDMLDEAQRSHHLVHLDRDVQGIARNLSLLADHNAPDSDPSPKTSIQTQSTPIGNTDVQSLKAEEPIESQDDNDDNFDDLVAEYCGEDVAQETVADDDDEIDLT